ncbi:MAG: LytTR family DNA-binding domain-containing protein [Flavobacteriaceae bacterium]
MKKDQIYLFTFLGLTIITFIVSYFGMRYLLEVSTNHFLRTQIESSKREAREISNLVQFQIDSGLPKEIVVNNLQKSIENTNTDSGYVSMFDWSGFQICHPIPEKIGRQILPDETIEQPPVYSELNSNEFYELLKNKKRNQEIKDISDEEGASEVIYLYPVKNTDWIVAAHANIGHLDEQMQRLNMNFIIVYTISGILIVIMSVFMVRLINMRYEKLLEKQNEGLSKEVLNLSRLNNDLLAYKEKKVKTVDEFTEKSELNATAKKRILTYLKDEIVSVDTNDIAFMYTENTNTYICCLDGKIYNYGNSLEELYTDLDKTYFFRANRQFILSIKAITKIYKYGNNQLKIEVRPKSPVSIIVSKNKASEFKRWLSI